MRWIYLSPHLDDAVLSAGGLIYEQTKSGVPVEIWTLMCGYPSDDEYSPITQSIHASWKFSSAHEAIRDRRAEDRNAAVVVGATTRHFDFLDCIYRRASNGEWLYSEIAVSPHEADAGLPSQIAEAISVQLLPDDIFVCQLAVGSHVDHVIVRQAAELLGRPLRFDIDVPYIFYKPQELETKSAGMKESVHLITEAGLKSWKEAVLAYKSQIPTLGPEFDSAEKVHQSIQTYWSNHKGIRMFQRNE